MESIGDLLRTYIAKSGNTIYGIAQKSSINRTTLQKVLSEERPLSIELLNRLLPLLKLTIEEKTHLFSMVEIQRCGKALHEQRQSIKKMLEYFSSITCSDISFYNLPKRVSKVILNKIGTENSHTLYQGDFSIGILLNNLLLYECTLEAPQVHINIPGYFKLVKHMLMHGIQYCDHSEKLYVQHITQFIKDCPCDPALGVQSNISILANILFSVAFNRFKYDIRYYYSECPPHQYDYGAFPYYIIFSKVVVLLSPDCNSAILLKDKESAYYFRNHFEAVLHDTKRLIVVCQNAYQLLPHFIQLGENDCPVYSLEYQPCLFSYLSQALLLRYLRPEFQDNEQAISLASDRIYQLQGLTHLTCIFSKSGLLDFTLHGRLVDLPQEYVYPLNIEDRILLLKSLYEATKEDRQIHRMVNPFVFPISEQLYCVLHIGKGLDFNSFYNNENNYQYIHITEPTILDAFEDFFKYLLESPSVYSKEDTLSYIAECINMLTR